MRLLLEKHLSRPLFHWGSFKILFFKKKFIFLKKNNSRYCYYFNKWCCSDCVSYKKSVIPSKILDSFDFNEYQISKEGIKTIDIYFSKPIIRLSYQNPIVKRNRLLFDTLVNIFINKL